MENTPPHTAVIRKKLGVYRNVLAEVQNAHAGIQTPDVKSVGFALDNQQGSQSGCAAAGAGGDSILEIITYTNPALSYLVVLSGIVCLSAARYLTSPSSDWTVLSGRSPHQPSGMVLASPSHTTLAAVCYILLSDMALLNASPSHATLAAVCYILLGDMAFNFFRSVLTPGSSVGTWRGSGLTDWVVSLTAHAMAAAADIHDRYLTLQDPVLSLKVAGGLWAVAILGRYLSVWTMLAVAFGITFTIPVAVEMHRATVSTVLSHAAALVKSKWSKLGLTRKQRALVLLTGLMVMWMRSAWATRFIAVFLGALAVRCNLKPAEVEAIRQHAAPLTMSVKKRAARLSLAATDFAHRTLGTKVHFR